ncbi:hypothetical protein Pme01_56780 [Planosporangium mesophilum]|uniref:Uncharacterized protein n=1 Tax=Planosporangium mesophilum TaxID=689768 RepID=A0A8J3TI95_9ACTN|nr:hypothetical protein Pme01_56780 [Planosporangium mesophilum]
MGGTGSEQQDTAGNADAADCSAKPLVHPSSIRRVLGTPTPPAGMRARRIYVDNEGERQVFWLKV